MKKFILIFLAFYAIGRVSGQTIPDGGFETWNKVIWMDPQYYTTSNDGNNGANASWGIPSNVSQTAGKYGTYGVQISTILYKSDTVAGFMIDANVGEKGLAGGIPYNQKPTGIRFWYKYATTSIDTAVVLVMFKLKGNMIDSFLVAIPSSQVASAYTLRSYYHKHPLSATPDSIIFGAASSKGILNQKNTMKGINPGSIFVIDSVTFTGVSSQPAELNGNFENWVNDTLNYPSGWYVSYPGATLTTDHYAGNYALQLETVNSLYRGVQQGDAATGYWPNNCNSNCNELGGFPYTMQKDTFEFWYKYAPTLHDSAEISIAFIKNGLQINCCTGITISAAAATWTHVVLPFDYITAPDTAIINISSSVHNHDTNNAQYAPYVGSILKIDNMFFASQKSTDLGINTLSVINGIKVYPNPSNGQFTVTNLQPGTTMEVYDYSGREISSMLITDITMQLNLANQANGVYLLRLISDKGELIGQQKIIKF